MQPGSQPARFSFPRSLSVCGDPREFVAENLWCFSRRAIPSRWKIGPRWCWFGVFLVSIVHLVHQNRSSQLVPQLAGYPSTRPTGWRGRSRCVVLVCGVLCCVVVECVLDFCAVFVSALKTLHLKRKAQGGKKSNTEGNSVLYLVVAAAAAVRSRKAVRPKGVTVLVRAANKT